MPRRIIIDTDPGIDDAIAILLALASPGALEVLGIVAVAGNLPLALTERNLIGTRRSVMRHHNRLATPVASTIASVPALP